MQNHSETAMILRCMDKRLLEKVVDYLRQIGLLGHCYDPARAGAVKDLLNADHAGLADSVWKDIEIGINRGGVNRIILCNHTDCAAYGGSGQFNSFKEEKEFHIKEMKQTRGLILKRYPNLKVDMVLAIINSSGEVKFSKINK